MDTKIAEKWIEMLESGNYSQANQKLRRNNGFCCLGVLCELYIKETGEGAWHTVGFSDYTENDEIYKFKSENDPQGSTDVLPTEVKKWAGMTSDCGAFAEKKLSEKKIDMLDSAFGEDRPTTNYSLTEYNDYSCYSFADIAKIIRIVKEDL